MKQIILVVDPDILPLAKKVGRHLNVPVLRIFHRCFPDGESLVRVSSQVAGKEVVVMASLSHPDPKIFPLLLVADACRRLKAKRIILVAPYLPYMRQDKIFHRGEAVAAPLFAKVIAQHFDKLVTIDPHLHRIHELKQIYSIPTTTLSAMPLLADFIRQKIKNPILIGPDAESKQWLKKVAEKYGFEFVVLKKKRYSSTKVRIVWDKSISIQGRSAVIIDDIVSSGGTMIEIVKQLKKAGFRKIVCIVVHPIFADDSYNRIKKSGATVVLSCNTILHRSNRINISSLLEKAL